MSLKRLFRPTKSLYTCICMSRRETLHSGRYLRRPVDKSLSRFYCSSKPPSDDILDMVKKLQELPVEGKQEQEEGGLTTKEGEDGTLRTEERKYRDLGTERKWDRNLDTGSLNKALLEKQDKLENTKESMGLDRYDETSNQSSVSMDPVGDIVRNLHVVHAKITKNNMVVSLTNESGDHVIGTASCGTVGFRNAKKRTDMAIQHLVQDIVSKAERNGVYAVRIKLKGFLNTSRFIKAMIGTGIKIVSITDVTHVPLNGNKPKKRKR